MAAVRVTSIHDITNDRELFTIKVMVIRLWKHDYGMDLVLMDEQGDKIQASIRSPQLRMFESEVQEDKTFVIGRFRVVPNTIKYPFTKHPYKLNFTANTYVRVSDEFTRPRNTFSFVSFDSILNREVPVDSIVDVIASVTSNSPVNVFPRNGIDCKRITLHLEDTQGKKLECTLWGEYVDQFSSYIEKDASDGCTIIIIQFAKIGVWKGNPIVQNSYFGSKLFINADLEEIIDFRRRLSTETPAGSSSHIGSNLSIQTVYSDRDSFLQETHVISVEQLLDTKQSMDCVLLGTIKSIDERYGWFYLACGQCNKKVKPRWEVINLDAEDDDASVADDNASYCPQCKKIPTSIVPRYRINIRVEDDTGVVTLLLFNSEVVKIINKPAIEIRERQIKSGNDEDFPEELTCLIGRQGVFKTSISDFNINNNWHVYTVSKLSFDDDVFSAIQTKKAGASFTAESSSINDTQGTMVTPVSKRMRSQVLSDDDDVQESSTKKILHPVKIEKP